MANVRLSAMCEFVSDARWTFESYARVLSDLADLRAELAKREAEIALLKSMLLELEMTDAQG